MSNPASVKWWKRRRPFNEPQLEILDSALLFFEKNQIIFKTEQESYNGLYDHLIKEFPDRRFTDKSNDITTKYLLAIIHKLMEDGYLKFIPGLHLSVTFEGMLFIQSASFPYKHLPYTYQSYKENLKTVWFVVKVIAAVVNAIAIILLAYFQVFGKPE